MNLLRRWYLRLKRKLGYETLRERHLRLLNECLQRRFDAIALDLLIQAMTMPQEIKKLIEDTVDDLVGDFLYYDRQDDEELEQGVIEAAIEDGVITEEEIVEMFRAALRTVLGE